MKKTLLIISLLTISTLHAAADSSFGVVLSTSSPLQGDPVMVMFSNTSSTTLIKKVLYDKRPLGVFVYNKVPTAFLGIGLNEKIGEHTLSIYFIDNTVLQKTITVMKRQKEELPLGIPKKLGGDTPKSGKKLLTALEKENALLGNLKSNTKSLWSSRFLFPLKDTTVVDQYGYSRKTGGYTISHLGTDFRAPTGTKVYSMNRGVARVVRISPIYGKLVIVDHGLGLMTWYAHMSKIYVTQGQLVEQGKILGLSGETGYALAPHLHVSIRLNNISVDPMVFMNLLK